MSTTEGFGYPRRTVTANVYTARDTTAVTGLTCFPVLLPVGLTASTLRNHYGLESCASLGGMLWLVWAVGACGSSGTRNRRRLDDAASPRSSCGKKVRLLDTHPCLCAGNTLKTSTALSKSNRYRPLTRVAGANGADDGGLREDRHECGVAKAALHSRNFTSPTSGASLVHTCPASCNARNSDRVRCGSCSTRSRS